MKISYSPQRFILFLLLIFSFSLSEGQDKALLKHYTWKQFEIIPSWGISYQTDNFILSPVPQIRSNADKPSLKKIKALKDTLKITSNYSYFKKIGLMYYALNKKDSGRYYLNEALTKYNYELYSNPADTALLHEICSINYLLGNVYQSMQFADSLLKINPDDSKAIFKNIMMHSDVGDYAGAKMYCEIAIEKFPENPASYLSKTSVICTEASVNFSEQTKESFNGFHFDVSFLQNAANNYRDNASIQLATLSCELMLLYYSVVMPMNLNPPKSYKNFKIQLTKNDSAKLESYENKYLNMIEDKKYNNHYTLYYSLGIINFLKGNYPTAINYFKTSAELCGSGNAENVLSCYDNIRNCYFLMGDTKKAKKWTKKKVKNKILSSSLADNYTELAIYELSEKRLQKGTKYLKKAIKLDSTNYEAYVLLANIEMLNNNWELAEKYLDRCFKIQPGYEELYESFILLSLFLDDKESARFFVNQFLANAPENNFARNIKRDFLE